MGWLLLQSYGINLFEALKKLKKEWTSASRQRQRSLRGGREGGETSTQVHVMCGLWTVVSIWRAGKFTFSRIVIAKPSSGSSLMLLSVLLLKLTVIFFSLVMQCEFWYTLMCPFSWMAGSNHLTFLGSAKVMMASTHMGGLLAAKKVIPSSHLLSWLTCRVIRGSSRASSFRLGIRTKRNSSDSLSVIRTKKYGVTECLEKCGWC